MKNTLRKRAHFTLMLLALSALAACGDDGDGNKVATPQDDESANQVNALPRAQLRNGGKVTFAIEQIPPNFNYSHAAGALRHNYYVITALMPTTYTNDVRGTPVWNRDLLASQPVLTTDPKQVVTYQINPRAVWLDGTPITWEDFYWQWKSNSGSDARYQLAGSSGYEDMENVAKGKDDREVIVTYRNKYADWTAMFNQLYPASTNRDPKVFNEGWTDGPLTSAGPFRVAEIDNTGMSITLVRNEKWWGDPAMLDTIVFRAIVRPAQIDALANGEIDAVDIGPDANIYARAKNIEGVEVRVAGGPNFRHLTINGTNPILQDEKVRHALVMAIDRPTIARAMLGPLGIAPTVQNNHIFVPNQNGYQDNSGELGKFNPEKAKQLLDEAGWKSDGTVRRKDGKPLALSVSIPATILPSKQEAELVQNMLRQIHIDLQIKTVPLNDLFDKYIMTGQFDMSLFAWMGTAYPTSAAKSRHVKPRPGADGTLDIKQNYARIGLDGIDSLFDQANRELDRNKALVLANRADSIIWQQVHSLPTYQRPDLIATKKNLANFGAFGIANPWVYQNIGWVKQ